MTIVTLTQAQINDGLRSPGRLLGANQFSFSIPNASSSWNAYAPGTEPYNSLGTLSAVQAASFRQAIGLWDELIAPDFTEVTETASIAGEVRVAFTASANGVAYAYSGTPQPPGGRVGDIWIDQSFAGSDYTRGVDNGLFAAFFLHEIGHTLGLKHPFQSPVIPAEFENQRFTVMSYTPPETVVKFTGNGGSINANFTSATNITPMVLDIAAVQAIYGAAPGTRAGDTIYRFDPFAPVLQSLYDAGGIDTFDASDQTRPNIIDLRPGAYSSIAVFSLADQIAYWSAQFPAFASFIANNLTRQLDLFTFTDNVGIALATTIENAFGGAADDQIVGNTAVNMLRGNGGNDILDGGSAADLLYGGAGDDTYRVDLAADLIFEAAGEGDDTAVAGIGYYLYANVERLQLAVGAGDIFGVGNDLANTLTGNEGRNLLIGGLGNDTIAGNNGDDALFGESGNDTLNGDAGIDYLVGGDGNDTLDGGSDADAIYGEDGNDTLRGGSDFVTDILVGGTGNDTLFANSGQGDYDLIDGGAGDDTYYVDTPADLTFEGLNGGTDTIRANIIGAGYYLYANTENLVLEGTTPFGVGNVLNNSLTGNAIGNYLLGGQGNDTINGKAGNDVLFGEAGADTFIFERGTGGDVIADFQPGADKIQLTGLGITSFVQLQSLLVQNANTTAIDLGQGDFIVLNGITNAALTNADFIFG